jgi:hypothetical protein
MAAVNDAARAVRIRRARADEGGRLRDIAVAAKGYWGYDLDDVRRWAEGGDFSADGLRAKEVYVAEAEGHAVAWAALVPDGNGSGSTTCGSSRSGWGRASARSRHAIDRAIRLGGSRLEWEAEPNAVGFYEKLGGRYLRDGRPSAWGRVIPVMGIDLVESLGLGGS